MGIDVSESLQVSTGQLDRNEVRICLGDLVRKFDCVGAFFEGRVVLSYGAYRVLMEKDYNGNRIDGSAYLQYNTSLLYDEVRGTTNIEVIQS